MAWPGTARGFSDLEELGFIRRTPRLVAGEVWGALTHAQAEKLEIPVPVEAGPTAVTSIGGGRSTFQALQALEEGERARGDCDGRRAAALAERACPSRGHLRRACVAGVGRGAGEAALGGPAAAVGGVRWRCITASGLKDPGAGGVADNVPVIQPTLDDLERALRDVYGVSPTDL